MIDIKILRENPELVKENCAKRGFTDVDIDEGLSMRKSMQQMEVDVLAAMTGI